MSRPDPSHEPTSSPDDAGADLLAHLLGQLEPERAADLERRLGASAGLREERDRLAADLAAYRAGGTTPPPSASGLANLLAEIEDEAAERRADHAVARSALPPDVGATVVAHALGQLRGESAKEAERIVAENPEATAEVALVGRLVAATRKAYSVRPSEETDRAVLAAFVNRTAAHGATGLHDVPAPESRPQRGGHLVQMIVPALIAAAALVVLSLIPMDGTPSHVTTGALLHYPQIGSPATVVDSDNGGFEFEVDHVIAAEREAVTVHVACTEKAEAAATGAPVAGTAAFTLEPGARLRRVDASVFALLAGRVHVEAVDLKDQLEIGAGNLFAAVRGTRFDVLRVDDRLVAIVLDGTVELGRRGTDPKSLELGSGEQGLVDATRLLRATSGSDPSSLAFLTPRASLQTAVAATVLPAPVILAARLEAGLGGTVRIPAFDPSQPLFVVRLTGPDGRVKEVKLQDSMITSAKPVPAADGTWSLEEGTPYVLALAIPSDGLYPGEWTATLRYMSYRANASGGEWLGVVESEPWPVEVSE